MNTEAFWNRWLLAKFIQTVFNDRGKCAFCGNHDLRVLAIDQIGYYNHHEADNGKTGNNVLLGSLK